MRDVFQLTWKHRIAIFLFTIATCFCSSEIVPGWGILDLHWPEVTYYSIMMLAGGLCGLLVARHPVPGFLGGVISGFGGLHAEVLLLTNVEVVWNVVRVVVLLLGILPGILFYAVLRIPFQRAEELKSLNPDDPIQEELI